MDAIRRTVTVTTVAPMASEVAGDPHVETVTETRQTQKNATGAIPQSASLPSLAVFQPRHARLVANAHSQAESDNSI